MKLTNWIIEKAGIDKVLHFLGGAWITALGSPFGWWGILACFIIAMVLSFIKEGLLDSSFDWKDIFAAFIGSAVSTIIYLIIFFIL